MMAKAANEFALKQLAPNREENDKYPFGPYFADVVQKAFELDFFHIMLPEALNGMNLGISALSTVLESICREDSSLGGIIFTTVAAQEILRQAGADPALQRICDSQKAREFLIGLPVFNNPGEVRHLAQARWAAGQCTLSGRIEYMVLGGTAKQALVPVQTPGAAGFSYALVNMEEKGVRKSEPILSLGLHACPAVDVDFDGAKALPIGQEGQGGFYFDKMADRMHAAAAAMSVGQMKGSFREALDYAKKREQGGHAIINWSEVKMILANMAIKITNAEMILEKACQAADAQTPRWEAQSRAAALMIQEMACDVTTDGIQVLGGVGYMKDFGQEKRFRDAKHTQALLGIAPAKKIKFMNEML
ncbi:MAG: acyl-CoA/acyl-ACP dehydrogenase [Desulfobacterales bacterium]|nr:acyl-CoA/acyl-ACP dehydrogenase [Desulfobacterales bacterium]